MSNVFYGKKLINSMRQALNLERLLCKSKFMPVEEHFNGNSCGKPLFNYESRNLIYVVTCQGCQEEYIGETGCFVKERISVYRQHIRQPQSGGKYSLLFWWRVSNVSIPSNQARE